MPKAFPYQSSYNAFLKEKYPVIEFTPILIKREDINPPTTLDSRENIDPRSNVVLEAPSYYVSISFPEISLITIPSPSNTFRVNFPKEGPLKNTIKLLLPPTVGYGLTSTYKVSYNYYYRPRVNNFTGKVVNKHLLKENWLVPKRTGRNIYSYEGLRVPNLEIYSEVQRRTKSFTLTRSSNSTDVIPPENLDIVSIDSISINNNILNKGDYFLVEGKEIGFNSSPLLNTTYTVTYLEPFRIFDLLFIDEKIGTFAPSYNSPYGPHLPISY